MNYPKNRKQRPEFIRFWEKVVISNKCWEWQAQKTAGYGIFTTKEGRGVRAHRWAYERLVGLIPGELVIDHLCRNPSCVNPNHLEPVSRAENNRRGIGFGGLNAQKTKCNYGHSYSGDNLIISKRGYRVCRVCRDTYNRAMYLKKKGVKL